MKIRKYKVEDCDTVSKLFFETVHSVNAKDYTDEQLFAWASSVEDLKKPQIRRIVGAMHIGG